MTTLKIKKTMKEQSDERRGIPVVKEGLGRGRRKNDWPETPSRNPVAGRPLIMIEAKPDRVFRIWVEGFNKKMKKKMTIRILLKTNKKSYYPITVHQLRGITHNIVDNYKSKILFRGRGDGTDLKATKITVRKEILNVCKNMQLSNTSVNRVNKLADEYAKTEGKFVDANPRTISNTRPNRGRNNMASPLGKFFPGVTPLIRYPSIFEQEDSATTCMMLGASWSGKTTFMVKELNKLGNLGKGKNSLRPHFIVLMTESPNAAPLKNLSPKAGVIVVDRWCPKISRFFTLMNKATKNAWRVLLINDDVVSGLRGIDFSKQCLTLRNNNISSCFNLQRPTIVSPDSRNNVHTIYILKLNPSDWKDVLKNHFESLMKSSLFPDTNPFAIKISDLIEAVRKLFKLGIIIKYDQRRDELSFIKR